MKSERHSPRLSSERISELWRLTRGLLKYFASGVRDVAAEHRPHQPCLPFPISILVVRTDGLGDFILFIPFLRCLRSLYPEARICLVVRRNVVDIAEACPYVNEVLAVADQQGRLSIGYLRYLSAFAQKHLRGRFDLALQPRWDVDRQWATLIAYLTRSPRIVGYTETTSIDKTWENWLYNRLLTEILPAGTALHEVERNLNVIRYLGGAVDNENNEKLEFWFSEEDRRAADRFMKEVDPSGSRPVIAFGVGAGEARRQWPLYAELIRLLLSRYAFVPVIIGGPQDAEAARQIQTVIPETRVLLSQPLRQVAAFLSLCELFVGNDSGPMHLASATGLPIVAIWCHPVGADDNHANSPARFGPWTKNAVVIRPVKYSGNCSGGCLEHSAHCIRTIEPERVADEVLKLTRLPALASGTGGKS